jgi:succinoglycan biosynthesis protein ExoA
VISIILPTLNEANYLRPLVENLLKSKSLISEIFICDAGSSDGTIAIIQELSSQYPMVNYFENKRKFVSFAFNDVYPLTTGKYMALLGSHALYPLHYLENGLQYLESGEADVVGGPLNQQGYGENGKAIALAMSSKFGVGDTEFRTSRKKQYVNSVAFAIYRKDMLQKIGLLDESLKRNQDDELHYRIKANGFKILMVPEMECTYYVRDSFAKLFNQYFEYGLYKPLVLKKVTQAIRIRHLIPALFVAYLVALPLFIIWIGASACVPLLLYVILAFIVSFKATSNLVPIIKVIYAILILHLSYGSGFFLGLGKLKCE